MSKAVYPGSFDPITNGHMDIIRRSARIFRPLIVAVLVNPQKKALFSIEKRIELISACVADIDPSIKVEAFDGLLVDYARSIKTQVILRGLRAVSDFEYEFQLALMNRELAPEIETIHLMAGSDVTFLSSGLVKEIWEFGGNISSFVPSVVLDAFNDLRRREY